MIRRRFLIGIWPAVACVAWTCSRHSNPQRVPRYTPLQAKLAVLLHRSLGATDDKIDLVPFLDDFIASPEGRYLVDLHAAGHLSDESLQRELTTTFILSSNLPDNGFEIAAYRFMKRSPACGNPWAVFG